jgi:multimeric flavodoxin WrbA
MEVYMKILGISCSPRSKGNTDTLMEQALEGAISEGAETELTYLRKLKISACDGCFICAEKGGKCHIQDNMNILIQLMEESEGIILGSPVYFWSVCGQAKIMIDRTLALRYPKLRLSNKVGGAILVAGKKGCMNASGLITYWMLSNHMYIADVVDGYAMDRGDIRKDTHAMKASFELGRLMVKLVEKKAIYPDEFDIPLYRYVEKKYQVNFCRGD